MKENDKVVYLDDEKTIIYYINKIVGEKVSIVGVNYRIYRTTVLNKIRLATQEEVQLEEKDANNYYVNIISGGKREKKRYILGRVLHIDGDKAYLDRCLELYEKIGVRAQGVCIKENEMPSRIEEYILELDPDIVVITGHDLYNQKGLKDLNNYTNTKYFIETVRKVRRIKSSYQCCVIAGACQSNFEALIANGADFASSPKRINVHTFDPAIIAITVATTSFLKIVNFNEALKYIENGRSAFGGVESLGKMKLML